MKLWTTTSRGKELTNAFLLLEKLTTGRFIEKRIATTKATSEALRKLIVEGLVARKKILNKVTNRLIYTYTATLKGRKEYAKLQAKWRKEVKPCFIN